VNTDYKRRAEFVFENLGLSIATTTAGQYFKSENGRVNCEVGLRWWFAPKQDVDRMGVQFLRRTANPDILNAASNFVGFHKKQGDRHFEIYREFQFMSDGTPDIAEIKATKLELLELLKKNEGKSLKNSGSYISARQTGFGKVFTDFLLAFYSLVSEKLFLFAPYMPKRSRKDHAQSVVFKSFVPAFRYKVENGLPLEEEIIDEELWQSDGVVYARTDKKAIAYIGKTDGPLKSRVRDHLRRLPNYTKPKDIAFRVWAEGKIITIYAHKPNNKNYLGLSVPQHLGLEYALIDAIQPQFVARK
jgi:hypothetical protein